MNTSEARDMNVLAAWILGVEQDPASAQAALERLADRARTALGSGVMGADVLALWPHRHLGTADDVVVYTDHDGDRMRIEPVPHDGVTYAGVAALTPDGHITGTVHVHPAHVVEICRALLRTAGVEPRQ
jgi:hypothetical protein